MTVPPEAREVAIRAARMELAGLRHNIAVMIATRMSPGFAQTLAGMQGAVSVIEHLIAIVEECR